MLKQTPNHTHSHPRIPEGFATANVSDAIARAEFNEATGIAMTPIVSHEVGGQQIDKLLVSMRPGVAVPVHLHEEGGESQTALTPVRAVFGVPKTNNDGGYETTEDGNVKFEVVENSIHSP